jgi:2-amino-4-hydroxy-6-hydroxymethyldihydropteridine diphosphokinase
MSRSPSSDPGMRDIAYVALGSNLGHREQQLAVARDAIARLPHTTLLAASDVEETAPLGPPQPHYLNQMLAIETELTPHELLDALLVIERDNGRVRRDKWGPRTLDLDIVKYEHQTADDETLCVPHPGLRDRDFWQRELAELGSRLAARP